MRMDNILLCVLRVYCVYPIHTGNWLWTVGAAWHTFTSLNWNFRRLLCYVTIQYTRRTELLPPGDTSWVNDTTLLPLHHCHQSGTRTHGGPRVWRPSGVGGKWPCWDHHTEIWWAATSTCSHRHVHTRRGWSWFKPRRNMLVFGLEFAFNFLQPAGSALLSLSHVISLVLHFVLAEEVRQSHDQPKGLCILYEYHSRLYVLW